MPAHRKESLGTTSSIPKLWLVSVVVYLVPLFKVSTDHQSGDTDTKSEYQQEF